MCLGCGISHGHIPNIGQVDPMVPRIGANEKCAMVPGVHQAPTWHGVVAKEQDHCVWKLQSDRVTFELQSLARLRHIKPDGRGVQVSFISRGQCGAQASTYGGHDHVVAMARLVSPSSDVVPRQGHALACLQPNETPIGRECVFRHRGEHWRLVQAHAPLPIIASVGGHGAVCTRPWTCVERPGSCGSRGVIKAFKVQSGAQDAQVSASGAALKTQVSRLGGACRRAAVPVRSVAIITTFKCAALSVATYRL